jgi:hypothetical protein
MFTGRSFMDVFSAHRCIFISLVTSQESSNVMAKAETATTRAPRGTKPVSQAFFAALETVPEAQRTAVARAAQVLIRDELKLRREKVKAAAAKVKAARAPAPKAAPAPKKAATPRKTSVSRKAAAPVVEVAEEKPAPKPVRKSRRSPEPKIAA